MSETSIQWTDRTWNPVRGCSRVSEGCRNCYAEKIAARFAKPGQPFHGFAKVTAPRDGLDRVGGRRNGWTGRVELVPEKLDEPLRWRKPQRVFVNSMSDLFHEALPEDAIRAVFATMARPRARHHTFQILTKRPERMRDLLSKWTRDGLTLREGHGATLPNVQLGVSVEDQRAADERIPLLLQTPAAVRFLSVEPLLGPVNLRHVDADAAGNDRLCQVDVLTGRQTDMGRPCRDVGSRIDWVIVGGESGPGARPCDVAWIRSVVEQCRAADVPVFVKQLGARVPLPKGELRTWPSPLSAPWDPAAKAWFLRLRDRKGGSMEEWPEDLRVREFPRVAAEGT